MGGDSLTDRKVLSLSTGQGNLVNKDEITIIITWNLRLLGHLYPVVKPRSFECYEANVFSHCFFVYPDPLLTCNCAEI